MRGEADESYKWLPKASSLIGDGARDGAVMRVISDYLYAQRDGKVSSTVTLLTADLDHKSLVISATLLTCYHRP